MNVNNMTTEFNKQELYCVDKLCKKIAEGYELDKTQIVFLAMFLDECESGSHYGMYGQYKLAKQYIELNRGAFPE